MVAIDTVYIVGPTASGKTALSVEVAELLNGEIVCADSQTVRRRMDIGTAKPSMQERHGIPHHMLDVIGPFDQYNLAMYVDSARDCMRDIRSRGKNVVVVGGTGLYIDALYYGFNLSLAGSSGMSREELEAMSTEQLQEMHRASGIKLPENLENRRHLVRSLERGGIAGSKGQPAENSLIVGIEPLREVLVERINDRVEVMFENGFVDEVRTILDEFGYDSPEFDAIGYRIVRRYINREISLDEAKELIKIADRQYAKRQMTWLKRNPHIQWFSTPEEAKSFILRTCLI